MARSTASETSGCAVPDAPRKAPQSQPRRALLTVSVNLDPTPGRCDNAEDFRVLIEGYLSRTVAHYEPLVEVAHDGRADG